MRLRTLGIAAVVLATAVTLTACGDDDDGGTSSTSNPVQTTATASAPAAAGDIVGVASTTPGFTTLVAAVTAADLATTLQGAGPYTVFAPTDEAFAKLPAGVLDKLLLPANKATLAKILTYHVVAGEVKAADIQPGDVATVEGQTVALSTTGGVKVNDANVTTADVEATNGVIHVIDAVLIPPDVDPSKL